MPVVAPIEISATVEANKEMRVFVTLHLKSAVRHGNRRGHLLSSDHPKKSTVANHCTVTFTFAVDRPYSFVPPSV